MSPETRDLLEQHDKNMTLDTLDYPDFQSRLQEVHSKISALSLDATLKPTQDAQFWGSVILPEFRTTYQAGEQLINKTPSLVFSLYGNLVTFFWQELLPEDVVTQISDAAESAGFILVDNKDLNEPYTGVHDDQKKFIKTWMDRYFNWL